MINQNYPIQVVISATSTRTGSIYLPRSLLVKTHKSVPEDYFQIFFNGDDVKGNKVRVAVEKVYWTNPDTQLDEPQPYSIVFGDGSIQHFSA